MTKEITFVTGNQNKLAEVRAILSDFDVEAKDLKVPEIQGTPQEIAKFKCSAASNHFKQACITEDTSLSFNAFGGTLPGPYIKYFIESMPLTSMYEMLSAFEDKTATARCIFAYSSGKDEDPILFEGTCEGKIVMPAGKQSFGWDAIFQPNEGSGLTFAEMAKEDKNMISHRSNALEKLRVYLDSL